MEYGRKHVFSFQPSPRQQPCGASRLTNTTEAQECQKLPNTTEAPAANRGPSSELKPQQRAEAHEYGRKDVFLFRPHCGYNHVEEWHCQLNFSFMSCEDCSCHMPSRDCERIAPSLGASEIPHYGSESFFQFLGGLFAVLMAHFGTPIGLRCKLDDR